MGLLFVLHRTWARRGTVPVPLMSRSERRLWKAADRARSVPDPLEAGAAARQRVARAPRWTRRRVARRTRKKQRPLSVSAASAARHARHAAPRCAPLPPRLPSESLRCAAARSPSPSASVLPPNSLFTSVP
ncbi:hypothetical protein PVAP13_4NG123619 [Panicum virgatum]|uniref:Uncharacterized protein n=1 Tax=Panicum virgatum TaxID=38727 RepID=A0A8T0T1Q0_PANVG|nr:hypothetical protein PVAP13_4NG123619 [Panicum virgatum]